MIRTKINRLEAYHLDYCRHISELLFKTLASDVDGLSGEITDEQKERLAAAMGAFSRISFMFLRTAMITLLESSMKDTPIESLQEYLDGLKEDMRKFDIFSMQQKYDTLDFINLLIDNHSKRIYKSESKVMEVTNDLVGIFEEDITIDEKMLKLAAQLEGADSLKVSKDILDDMDKMRIAGLVKTLQMVIDKLDIDFD